MRFVQVAALVMAIGCGGNKDADETGTGGGSTVDVTPYENLPIKANFLWYDATIDGKHVVYHVSTDTPPKAVLFIFHGLNGNIQTVQQLQWLQVYNRLVPQGVAVVLTQSLDRTTEKWDNDFDPQNPDFRALVNVRQWMIDNTLVDEDTPVEAIGFSNGGIFVDVFAGLALGAGWDMRTFVAHNASSYVSTVPAMFISAENDEAVEVENVVQAAAQCSSLGEECPHIRGTEVPLDPRRFALMPEYSLEDSQAVFDELVDLEYVDADGNRTLADISDPDAVMSHYEAVTQITSPSPSLPPTELRVVWSTHRFSAQHMEEEVAWLLDHL